MGATLNAVLPTSVDRWAARLVGTFALAWATASLFYERPINAHRMLAQVIRMLPPPPPGPGLTIENCSDLGAWRASHLFQFYWDAAHIDCHEAPSPGMRVYTFDGRTLVPATTP